MTFKVKPPPVSIHQNQLVVPTIAQEVIAEQFLIFVFLETKSQKAQVALELMVLLPPPPKCWDYRHVVPCLAALWKVIINKNKNATMLFLVSYILPHRYKDLLYQMKCFYMCSGVLPACMSMHHMHAVPIEARRGHRIAWNWSCRWFLGHVGWSQTWVLCKNDKCS